MNSPEEKQKQIITQERIDLIRLKIKWIFKSKDYNKEQKKEQISIVVIDILHDIWTFYKTKNFEFYFFDKTEKKIFKIKEQEFKFLLNQYFSVNGSTDYYKYLIEDLSSYISKNAKEVKIHDFSYYDIRSNSLYV